MADGEVVVGQVEVLQAENNILKADVDRYRQEVAKLTVYVNQLLSNAQEAND
jgi:hypothetical protein